MAAIWVISSFPSDSSFSRIAKAGVIVGDLTGSPNNKGTSAIGITNAMIMATTSTASFHFSILLPALLKLPLALNKVFLAFSLLAGHH
jgi:hypothetical protein